VTWNGLMAPAATPKPIVDKIAAEIAKACKDPRSSTADELRRRPIGITPAQFAELVAADLKLWAEAVAIAGVKRNSKTTQMDNTASHSHRRRRPVGVITALALARQGLPVHVFEAEAKVNDMPRAATTHAATLEMLAGLGMVDEVIERGWSSRCSASGTARATDDRRIRFRHPQGRDALPVRGAMRAAQAGRHGDRAAEEISPRQGRVLGRVTSLDQFADGVEIEVETAEAPQGRGLYLIGATAAARPCARRSASSSRATPIPNAS
jgi:hypothetical protein